MKNGKLRMNVLDRLQDYPHHCCAGPLEGTSGDAYSSPTTAAVAVTTTTQDLHPPKPFQITFHIFANICVPKDLPVM